jgi:hypothetical protein
MSEAECRCQPTFDFEGRPVLVVLGLTKILSVLKLWRWPALQEMPTLVAYVGLGAAALCAAVAHAAVEGPAAAAPPVIYLALMAIHYHLESSTPTVGGTKVA